MDQRVIALVKATINLDDILNVVEDVMEMQRFELDYGNDEPCEFDEADCGDSWCQNCGCLQYKRLRLKRAIAAAEALWSDVAAADPEATS